MTIADKERSVAELKEKIDRASAIILTEYRGLKAHDLNRLRRALRQAGLEYRVVKNTVLRRATEGTFAETAVKGVSGPTAILFGYEDSVTAARVITERANEFDALAVKCGLLDRQFCPATAIEAVAKLPGRQEMLGIVAATVRMPLTYLANTLHGVMTQLVGTLQAYLDKKAQL